MKEKLIGRDIWYRFIIEDLRIKKDVLLYSVFNENESLLEYITVLVKNNETWQQYQFVDNKWVKAPYVYTSIEKFNSMQKLSQSNNYIEINVDLDCLKNLLVDKYLSNIGLSYTDFDPNDYKNFILGVKVGIDDNLLFGLQQFFGMLEPYYEDYFFVNAKIQTDAAFMMLYTEMSKETIDMPEVNAADAFGKAARGLVLAVTGTSVSEVEILTGVAFKNLVKTAGLIVD